MLVDAGRELLVGDLAGQLDQVAGLVGGQQTVDGHVTSYRYWSRNLSTAEVAIWAYDRQMTSPVRRGAARRDELSDALVALLLAEGFAHLTLDDVAARLRCSKRTLYALAGDARSSW